MITPLPEGEGLDRELVRLYSEVFGVKVYPYSITDISFIPIFLEAFPGIMAAEIRDFIAGYHPDDWGIGRKMFALECLLMLQEDRKAG